MENLLLGNQVIILESNIELDDVKKKVSKMRDILSKFTIALESIYPEYNGALVESRDRLEGWEHAMMQTDAPKGLLMCELVQYINSIRKNIEETCIDFADRHNDSYIENLFQVDMSQEYEPLYFLRPISLDFIKLWNDSRTTLATKKQIVSYLFLIVEFGKNIMDSFVIMDKDEFEEKYGFDLANFDLDNMNFNVSSISSSFADMLKKDNDEMDTTPLTETVNTVLTEFLGVDSPDQNINLSTLQDLHFKAKESGEGPATLTGKLDKIQAALDAKGIDDQDLMNSVKNLSAAFTKNSGVKNPKIKQLFEKLSTGDLNDPQTFMQAQQMMAENPIFKQFNFEPMTMVVPPTPVSTPASTPVPQKKQRKTKRKGQRRKKKKK